MKTYDATALADEVRSAGVVVVGTGVAGLTAALELAPLGVTVLTKTRFGAGGSSPWAQGGIAAAMSADDSPELHAIDTAAAGAGLCERGPVAALVQEGPGRVRDLIDLGARFDRGDLGELLLGREGAHQRRRVLHARGDATGAEMVRALVDAALVRPGLEIFEHAFATDLVVRDGRVTGVLATHGGRTVLHRASAVVLATGGFGQVYARTTNPVENTGDGLAMAARAGARLADLEMVQFHPTALAVASDPLPLVTEALRGEGAVLLDDDGRRFMVGLHPQAELAPRDVVARAIWGLQDDGGGARLDARDAVGDAFPERFPTVWGACRRHGIDPIREPIPVTPAAHYAMAGVAVDGYGRSSLDGLWACGEVTATGVHGANRLASNSLLEALVFGARVAVDIQGMDSSSVGSVPGSVRRETLPPALDRSDLRRWMWRRAGLVRDRVGLEGLLDLLGTDRRATEPAGDHDVHRAETRNLWTVARLVTAAALVRRESRGSHHRRDFPETDLVWRRRLFWTYRDGPAGELPLQKTFDADLAREIA